MRLRGFLYERNARRQKLAERERIAEREREKMERRIPSPGGRTPEQRVALADFLEAEARMQAQTDELIFNGVPCRAHDCPGFVDENETMQAGYCPRCLALATGQDELAEHLSRFLPVPDEDAPGPCAVGSVWGRRPPGPNIPIDS